MQRLLPPVLVFLLLIVASVLTFTLPLAGPPAGPWRLVGVIPLVGGLALTARGAGLFARIGTNIKTFNEPGTLVTDGPFRFTRNPMYLGFVLLLIGAALMLGALTAWVAPAAFFAAANLWYIPFEEQRMAAQFGDAYTEYRRRVPRWLSITGGA